MENNKSNLKVVVLGAVGALIAILAFKAYERSQQIAEVNNMFTSMNINAEVNFDGTVDVGENTYKLDGLDFVNTKTGQRLSIMQLGQEMINVNKKPKPEEYATTDEKDNEIQVGGKYYKRGDILDIDPTRFGWENIDMYTHSALYRTQEGYEVLIDVSGNRRNKINWIDKKTGKTN